MNVLKSFKQQSSLSSRPLLFHLSRSTFFFFLQLSNHRLTCSSVARSFSLILFFPSCLETRSSVLPLNYNSSS
ncbi:hypothetical protein L596_017565 [Steinernema carpocapsae]|uniref:Uncharacterized protein n=1 Tax=Steinernema carpocapsae TaxID=34508 RepID=A0A4U5N226_STECR|nr:hypothetical protein L596_017565 [Steinernema carpocapsae]